MRPPFDSAQDRPDTLSSSAAQLPRGTIAPTDHMAATATQPNLPPPPQQPHFVGERPTLPPLAPLRNPPLTTTSSLLPAAAARHRPSSPLLVPDGPPVSFFPTRSPPRQATVLRVATTTDPSPSLDVYGSSYDPRAPPPQGVKRSFDQTRDLSAATSVPPGYMIAQPSHEDDDERGRLDTLMAGKRMSLGSVSTNPESISSVQSILGGMQRQQPLPRAPLLPAVNAGRYTLHLRQQPRAARAGPDGKDRRAVDPPPVLQLLIDDFDPESDEDMADMRNHFWVVHTKLIPAHPITSEEVAASLSASSSATVPPPHQPPPLPQQLHQQDMARNHEVTRLLLGTTVSSPFFCADDPDPETAPKIPTRRKSRSPSPTSRFITTSTKTRAKESTQHTDPANLPATFFIFADLSIRKAGEYKLEFRLMRMDPLNLHPGSIVPTISSVTSQTFRVVNAKDFDQVQPSTNLVRGLLDRGAGFPLKLKKGVREGQRRRNMPVESGDDSDGDNEIATGGAATSTTATGGDGGDDDDDEGDDGDDDE